MEVYKKLSTPGVADGKIIYTHNAVVDRFDDKVVTREEGFSYQMNSVLLGLMFANISK